MGIGITILVLTVSVFSLAGIYHSKSKKVSLESFISAHNSFPTGLLTLTIVMTGMGAWILFSPAEATVIGGLPAILGYVIGSSFAIFSFIWLGKKIRDKIPSGNTLTEYIYLRYGKWMYGVVLIASVFYMGVFLTAELTGIALASELVFGIPLGLTVVIIGLGTLFYTVIGGLRASVFTDKIQSWIILPLLGVIFIASYFLGAFDFIKTSYQLSPELFSFSNWSGVEYGITLIIAIIGAELFNNANWQRVYAAKSVTVMRKSFLLAGIIVIPIVLLTGLFGFFAFGAGTAEVPSIAMFSFLLAQMPSWIIVMTMILAIGLVMSSMDSLLSGIASLGAVDLIRLSPDKSKEKVLSFAKWMTVVVVGVAMLVSLKGFSVLYLFLVADLVCVAAVFPTFYGLFNKKHSGRVAVTAVVLGLIAGAFLFPDPSWSRGNLLWSFVIALVVPVVVSVIGSHFEKESMTRS